MTTIIIMQIHHCSEIGTLLGGGGEMKRERGKGGREGQKEEGRKGGREGGREGGIMVWMRWYYQVYRFTVDYS